MSTENKARPVVAAVPPGEETLEDLAKRAGPIARNARLDSITVKRLVVDLIGEVGSVDDSALLSHSHVVEHHFENGREDVPGRLRVLVSFTVKVESGTPAQHIVDLKCSFDVRYELPGIVPEAVVPNFGAFAKTNTLIHVWPYFRELVQSMTARMGLPPLPLPLFRITDHVPRAPNAVLGTDAGSAAPKGGSGSPTR